MLGVPRRLPAETSLNRAVASQAVWDLPTRFFHWLLAALAVLSYVTGKAGGPWLEWHMKSGYAILALLLFRFAWAIVGPAHARFASFVRGPRAVLEYARTLLAGNPARVAGHNPLGGWMVAAMLAAFAFQAATGLFSDDDSSHTGPLAGKVSEAMVGRLSALHEYNQWLLVALVAVHVAAIGWYHWRWKMDLVRPMVVGPIEARITAFGAALLAIACAFVYWLVVVYPR
jgi:cytochrome b